MSVVAVPVPVILVALRLASVVRVSVSVVAVPVPVILVALRLASVVRVSVPVMAVVRGAGHATVGVRVRRGVGGVYGGFLELDLDGVGGGGGGEFGSEDVLVDDDAGGGLEGDHHGRDARVGANVDGGHVTRAAVDLYGGSEGGGGDDDVGGAGGDLDVVRLDGGVEGWRERRLGLLEALGGLEVDRAALGEGELGVHLRRARRERRKREGQARARRGLGVRAWDATPVVASPTRRTRGRRARDRIATRRGDARGGSRGRRGRRERRARGRRRTDRKLMTAAMVRSFAFETPRARECGREARTRGRACRRGRRAHQTQNVVTVDRPGSRCWMTVYNSRRSATTKRAGPRRIPQIFFRRRMVTWWTIVVTRAIVGRHTARQAPKPSPCLAMSLLPPARTSGWATAPPAVPPRP